MKTMDLFGRKSPVAILGLFLMRPSAEMTVSHVIDKTKLAKAGAIRWAREMEKHGILISKIYGKSRLYMLNRSNPCAKLLVALHNIDYVMSLVRKIEAHGAEIFLYGSFARGENEEDSDIDILVVGKNREIIGRLKSLDDRVKVSFYTPVEWSLSSRKNKAFYENVERDKIRLV